MIIYFLILLSIIHFGYSSFTPNRYDYNAYGLKIGMNDFFLVQVQNENDPPKFLIKFPPYNNSQSSLQCLISHLNLTNHYIYTLALGENQTQFFFAGELINEENGTFIGVAKYNKSALTCETSFTFSLQYFYQYEHQEYYTIGIRPITRFVYGFSNEFIYIFDTQSNSILNIWDGNLTWPDNSFMPHAVDLSDSFGIITGFIRNPIDTAISKYIAIIYLINFNSSTNYPIIIVDQYIPNATPDTWQDRLTNSDAYIYSAKYDMSIDINKNGNILIGMQFLNRVFLFYVNINNPNQLYNISRYTGGRSIGSGKSITWLDNNMVAILINSYSLTYDWSSSQIYFYDIQNSIYNSTSTPISVFPNNHQVLPTNFSSIFLSIVSSSSSSSLTLLVDGGNLLILTSTLPGFYPSIQDNRSMPIVTLPQPCLPGTYKNQTGIHDCILCPTGTKNPGNSSLQCLPCLSNSFCSLGAVSDIPLSALETTRQALAYPKSPESTTFDDILIQNVFTIGSGHCLIVSPIFWTLIVASLAIIIIIVMTILKYYITKNPRIKKFRERLKCIFRYMDVINEGELWIGGLASFCVIVLVSFSYSFSNQFLKQYPLETSFDSYFACDLSLRNAKFQTNIQSLSIPKNEFEQNMFDLLNNQTFNLNIELINTLIGCDVISIEVLYGKTWSSLRWTSCFNKNSILFLSMKLPYQHVSLQIFLYDIQTIGGLRVGLDGRGNDTEHYRLKDLNFYQSFSKPGQILAQSLPIVLDLTKIINETLPLFDEESEFTGIYIPTFTVDPNSIFLSEDQYIRSTSTLILLQIDIHETPYYVKNLQEPIAKRSEIIFHNFLFTTVCLEIFGFGFLLYKLIFKPICHVFFRQHVTKDNKQLDDNEKLDRIQNF